MLAISELNLNWAQRPKSLQQGIDQAYRRICSNRRSQWGFHNGASDYDLAGISDELLIKKTLLKLMKQGQRKFVFLDIAAGNFNWGKNMSNFLNSDPLFKNDIEVTIYSIRGERCLGVRKIQQGICTHYTLGSFKVENLIDEFNTQGRNLLNQVDLIVSSWCFRHLVDPTGTLLQAYELLKPGTGLITVDGFFLETTYSDYTEDSKLNLKKLFSSFQAPFYIRANRDGYRLDIFVMQKSDSPYQIPLNYKSHARLAEDGWQIGSRMVSIFKANPTWQQNLKLQTHRLYNFLGNPHTYFTSTPQGEALLQEIVANHSEFVITAHKTALNLFAQILNSNADQVSELSKGLHKCLRDLIHFDQSYALACVHDMLKLNRPEAINVLNLDDDFLYCIYYFFNSSNKNSVLFFKRLIEIASSEQLNKKDDMGSSLLIDVIHSGDYHLIQLLLSSSKINLKLESDEGETPLSAAEEKVSNIGKELRRTHSQDKDDLIVRYWDAIKIKTALEAAINKEERIISTPTPTHQHKRRHSYGHSPDSLYPLFKVREHDLEKTEEASFSHTL